MPKHNGHRAKVYLLNAHTVVRLGLAHLIRKSLELNIAGESDSGRSCLKDISKHKPGLLIMGLHLPDMNGLEFIKRVRSRFPHLPILVLSSYEESLYAQRCLLAGAKGFVGMREDPAVLLAGIQKVLEGHAFVSAAISKVLRRKKRKSVDFVKPSLDRLSNRELEVFRLVGEGLRTTRIAKILGLSHKTIECYRENIKVKLNLSHASDLLQNAIQFCRLEIRR
jgi:DNA-binding NarL/FixJ family response regulator